MLDTEPWTAIPNSAPGGANATSFTVTGLANGTAHRFQVRAHNSVGDGAESAEVSATPRVLTAPARPTNLTATGGPGQVTLTWDAGTADGGVAIDRWEYRQRAGSGAYGGWTLLSTDPTTVQHVLTSLVPHTRYTYQVRAHNTKGNGSSATASATTTAGPPAQPTGLTATAGAGQVTLMWDAGTGNGGARISLWQYHRRRGPAPRAGWTRLSTDLGATQGVVTSLLANTLNTFQVRAHNSVGDGTARRRGFGDANAGASGAAHRTDRNARQHPGRPALERRDRPRRCGDQPLAVPWQYRKKEGAGNYGTWTQISTTSTTTQHEVSGLTNGVLYTFQVRAGNAGGGNGPSAEATATPNLTDYDSDDDGLIEISNAAQLNAIRWDVDGDGVVAAAD